MNHLTPITNSSSLFLSPWHNLDGLQKVGRIGFVIVGALGVIAALFATLMITGVVSIPLFLSFSALVGITVSGGVLFVPLCVIISSVFIRLIKKDRSQIPEIINYQKRNVNLGFGIEDADRAARASDSQSVTLHNAQVASDGYDPSLYEPKKHYFFSFPAGSRLMGGLEQVKRNPRETSQLPVFLLEALGEDSGIMSRKSPIWKIINNPSQVKAVYIVDAVYRTTLRKTGSHPPVNIPHIDFLDSDIENVKDVFKPIWQRLASPPVSAEEYDRFNILQMFNIWMPLNTTPVNNTLACMDMSTCASEDLTVATAYVPSKLLPGIAKEERVFSSRGCIYNPNHKWYINPDMKLGDAVIFDSQGTLHTAVNLSINSAEPRESVECRMLVVGY